MKMKVINCVLAWIVALSIWTICASAQAETPCERSRLQYEAGEAAWDRHCGPEPGKPFLEELKKDCATTTMLIAARNAMPGNFASWNSEYGWAFDSTCESLARGDKQ